MNNNDAAKVLGCLGFVVLVVGIVALNGWCLMVLWNWIMPLIFPSIVHLNIWTSFGVLAILSVIGGAIRGSSSSK